MNTIDVVMDTASCEGEDGCSESESFIDRFSNLPDYVAHHILSFLTIPDLTRFGCASKKCRELYLSTPSLSFDEFSNVNTSTCYKRLKLLRSLDTFLIHRGDNKIHHFRICWFSSQYTYKKTCFCDHNEKFRMITWIHNAVKCNVEVLDLEISIFEKKPLAFPSCILVCGSLRTLLVDMNCMIQTPSFTFSSNLKCLELKNVKIVDEGFFKWISCSCKCIEELLLENVGGIENVTIESSSLETFNFECVYRTDIRQINITGEKLKFISIHWRFDSPTNNLLNIFAPNLKYLIWAGNLMDHQNLGGLVGLEGFGIFLVPEEDVPEDIVMDLCSEPRSKILFLNEETIEALFRERSTPVPFENICYFRMHIWSFTDDLVPAVVFLLKEMPNLCTLYIKCSSSFFYPKSRISRFDMGYWKLQNLTFINQLKEFTIELCNESNGIELARYILEHAQNLEKMVIIYLPQQSNVIGMLDKGKMLSNTTLVFQEFKRENK